jgi:hypothetical protein
MIHFIHKGALLAAAAAAALVLPLAGTHGAAAQSVPQTDASCPQAAGDAIQPQQLRAQIARDQAAFAQELAQALNLPPATVQQGISGLNTSEQPAPAQPGPPTDVLAAAAQQLGVSADQLANAVRAADATLPCKPVAQPPSGSASAAAFFIGIAAPNGAAAATIDTSAFFATVAQNLGGSFTGQQVEAAFQANAPAPPSPTQLQTQIQSQLTSLATALGVSDAALTSALQSLGSSGACLPPGVLGGEVVIRTGAPTAPPSYGNGPLVIPIVKVGGPAQPPAIFDQLGIKPCGPDQVFSGASG